MNISGLQKLSLSDYPGFISAVIFTQGCNFNCDYCQNSSLIPNKKGLMEEEEILDYLKKRKSILDGLVISGGEPTVQKDLKEFIIKIKEFGYKIKLDTNGSNPKVLKDLLDNNLLDYVAMDIKQDKINYEEVTGYKKYNFESIKESIKILEESKIDYEFRTTLIKNYHDLQKVENILKIIDKKSKYYLQNFEISDDVRNKKLEGFTKEELLEIENKLKKKYPNLNIRGI